MQVLTHNIFVIRSIASLAATTQGMIRKRRKHKRTVINYEREGLKYLVFIRFIPKYNQENPINSARGFKVLKCLLRKSV